MAWTRAAGAAAVLTGALALAGLAGDEAQAPLPPDLGKVPGDAVGFVSVRLGDLWRQAAAQGIPERLARQYPGALEQWRQLVGLPPGDVERCTAVLPYLEVGPGPYPLVFVETAQPYDRAKILANLGGNPKEEKRGGEVLYVNGQGHAVHFLGDRAYVASSAGAVRDLLERPAPKKEGPLAAALRRAAGRHALVVGLNPEPIVREVGGTQAPEALRPLLKAESATLTLDVGDEADAELRLTFAGEQEAKKARPALAAALLLANGALIQLTTAVRKEAEGGGAEAERFADLFRRVGTDLKQMKVRQQGPDVGVTARLNLGLGDATVLLNEAVVRARQTAERVRSQNNLRQLALATINHADRNNYRLPAQAVYGPEGKPLLSWRVLILPYLDQETLYKEFHLNEPWDSEHNKALLARMPRVYAMPGAPEGATETHYLGFVGPGAFFEGRQGRRFPAEFPDGTSNTIMYVEAEKAVPWTKPEDLPYDPDPTRPLPKLGGRFRAGFDVCLCDGSVRLLRRTIRDTTLRGAITVNGGEVLGDDF